MLANKLNCNKINQKWMISKIRVDLYLIKRSVNKTI